MSNQEQEPQAEHLDTLDVLQAIVDAWRHFRNGPRGELNRATFRSLEERQKWMENRGGFEKALEMGRRHLEMEGRL